MKKIVFALALIFFSLPISAEAATATITAPSYRHLDGTFLNQQLLTDLGANGKFGKIVYGTTQYSTWRIDPAFIEDVVAATKIDTTKTVAEDWLARLANSVNGKRIEAIAYGNPSEYWINRFTPHDREYILTLSGSRLSTLLNRYVYPAKSYLNTRYFSLSSSQAKLVKVSEARIATSARYLDTTELENYKLAVVKLFNQSLSRDNRQILAYDLAEKINGLRDAVRLSTGKFTITSTSQKLPVTITNDFPQAIKVELLLRSTNERISVGQVEKVSIPGKSKIQVMIPVSVNSSGDSGFAITLKNSEGVTVGQTTTYSLKIAVISPVATWITTGAAVVLFGAAILQSLRRIRKGRT
jgi:hypothetical protein